MAEEGVEEDPEAWSEESSAAWLAELPRCGMEALQVLRLRSGSREAQMCQRQNLTRAATKTRETAAPSAAQSAARLPGRVEARDRASCQGAASPQQGPEP